MLTWIYFLGCCGLLGRLHPPGFSPLDANHSVTRDYERVNFCWACQLETDELGRSPPLSSARSLENVCSER